MDKKQKLIFITAAVLLILFILWFIFDGVSVEAYKVTKQSALKGVTVTGTVKSLEDVLVTSTFPATIEKFYVKTGDYVKKGQLIATLIRKTQVGELESAQGRMDEAYWELEDLLTEPREQQIEIAKAELDKAEQNFTVRQYTLEKIDLNLKDAKIDEERYKALEEAGAVSKRELEQKTLKRKELENSIGETREQLHEIMADIKKAKENLSLTINKIKIQQIKAAKGKLKTTEGGIISAEGALENYIITAPVSGIITEKPLHTGATATPTSPIVRLVNPKLIYLSMEVEENETEFIKTDQKAFAVFDAYPKKIFSCSVKNIIKQVNPSTGTFETRLTRPEGVPDIKVGMTVDATIITGKSKNVLIIPTDFIIQRDGKIYVFKKIGFWARKTYIKTENFDNNRTKILSGIKSGDIILKSIEKNKLKDGQHIKITDYYKL